MTQLIYSKMSAVMAEIGFVSKDQKNLAQGFKFRGIDQFVNALYPALVKHGVFMVPRCIQYGKELNSVTRSNGKPGVDKHVDILMEYDFFAEDGSKVTAGPVPAEGLDSGDKATNKALSAALKYALIQTFSVPTQDMAEADLDTPEIGTTVSGQSNSQGKPLAAVSETVSKHYPTPADKMLAAQQLSQQAVVAQAALAGHNIATVGGSITTLNTPIATSTTIEPFKKTSSFSKKKKELPVAPPVETPAAQESSEW